MGHAQTTVGIERKNGWEKLYKEYGNSLKTDGDAGGKTKGDSKHESCDWKFCWKVKKRGCAQGEGWPEMGWSLYAGELFK